MYNKYLKIMAKWCAEVFQDMAKTDVIEIKIKKDERLLTDIAFAHVVEYEHLDEDLKGYVMMGFNNKTMAVLVASAISENMGFDPVKELDEYAADILGEFVNTFVGRTISDWDSLGLPVRFGPPVSINELEVEKLKSVPSDAFMIILSLTVGHVVLKVTFCKSSKMKEEERRILIVDDSALIRKLLRKTLETDGYLIEEANNGKEAMLRHQSFQPHLTIMDIVMPVMGGLDAIVEIRESSPEAKFAVLTSSARKDEIVTAETLGVLKYIIKPITNIQSFLDDIRLMFK